MIEEDKGYHIYGTVNSGDFSTHSGQPVACVRYNLYNSVLFFMHWIIKTINEDEHSRCGTRHWTTRSSKRWIAREENGCLKGEQLH